MLKCLFADEEKVPFWRMHLRGPLLKSNLDLEQKSSEMLFTITELKLR